MDEIFRDFLVTFVIVAAVFGMVYVYYMTRHRERMSMMEKGLDLSQLASKNNARWASLKYGMLLIGIGIGTLFANILYKQYDLNNLVAFFSMTFLCGGLSLVAYFLIEGKYRK